MKNLICFIVVLMAITSTAQAACVDAPTFKSEEEKSAYVEKVISRIRTLQKTTKQHEQATLKAFQHFDKNPREILGMTILDYETKIKQFSEAPHATEILLKYSPKLWDEAMTEQIDPLRAQLAERSTENCTPDDIARVVASAKVNLAAAYGQDIRNLSSKTVRMKRGPMPLEGVARMYMLSMYEESILANQLMSIMGGNGKGTAGLKPSALREAKSNLTHYYFGGRNHFKE